MEFETRFEEMGAAHHTCLFTNSAICVEEYTDLKDL